MEVEVRRRAVDGGAGLELVAVAAPGPLVHPASLGAGVTLAVDPLAPDRWSRLAASALDEPATAVLAAIVGRPAADVLVATHVPDRLRVAAPPSAGPWLRLGVVDAIDRWLPLPLDQPLVDAERGVARLHAAATLPAGGAAHRLVVGDALRLARRASAGVVAHLARRRRRGSPVPAPFCAAFAWLVDGYRTLGTHVAGPDRELAAVERAWRAFRGGVSAGHAAGRTRTPPSGPRREGTSMIDPRRVPARVLCLSSDPDAGEVRLTPAAGRGLQVEVPAFGGDIDELKAGRLVVELVDRRTSEPVGHGLLTITSGPRATRRRAFRSTVHLAGRDAAELRAEVFDALAEPPPAGPEGVRDARRAVATLRAARRERAAAHIVDGATPADPDDAGRLLVAEIAAAVDGAR